MPGLSQAVVLLCSFSCGFFFLVHSGVVFSVSASDAQCGLGLHYVLKSPFCAVSHGQRFT